MIKAVFFDLYYTLVRYEPPREVLEAEALRAVGKNVEASALVKPLLAADEFLYAEIARRPLNERTREEKMDLYVRHQEVLLREAGIPADRRLAMQVLALGQQMKSELVLFDDVLPALGALKAMGLMLGLISNVDRDVSETLHKLGLDRQLDVIVTSQTAGAAKPQPKIFEYALRRAGISPAGAVYVGDQYQVDVVGARTAGMKAVLLDRNGLHGDIGDCPRIRSLSELSALI